MFNEMPYFQIYNILLIFGNTESRLSTYKLLQNEQSYRK